MHFLHFWSHHTSAFSHCSGIFRTLRHKWAVCPELTNPIPFRPILFSVYFTHKVLRKQLIPHSSKAPFCPENYKLASIPILIPPSRFAVSQLILIVWVWLNIHYFTARVRVSTNIITILHLPYILALGWGNDVTTTLYFSFPHFQTPQCVWIIVNRIWVSPYWTLAFRNIWLPQLRRPISQCFISVSQMCPVSFQNSDKPYVIHLWIHLPVMCELLHSNPTKAAPCIVNVHLIGIKKNSSTYIWANFTFYCVV